MRKAREIRLVLLGTGLALGLTACGESEACLEARAENRPDANAICRGSSSAWHSSYWGSGSSGSARASSARGGFGATGASHGGSSG
jgi:hypothetical protein